MYGNESWNFAGFLSYDVSGSEREIRLSNQRLDNVAFHIRETIIPALEKIG